MSATGQEPTFSSALLPVRSAPESGRRRGQVRYGPLPDIKPFQRRPSSCAQFFRYALHSRQAFSIGRSELRVHLEVSQCRSKTAFLLPRNAAVVIGFGIFRIEL